MKKGLAIVLSLWMVCLTTIGYAVTYTLPEKMSRQLAIGSGMKGSFVLNAEGDSETAAALRLFNQAEIQVRGMMSDKDWHYYLYQTDEAENQWARTDLYRKDGAVYLKSQLLKNDRVLMLPGTDTMLDTLIPGTAGNPSAASAIWNLAQMSEGTKTEVWDPLIAQLEERIESWLTPYASAPEMGQTEDGQTVIEMSYVIPTDALIACILDGVDLITGNAELMNLAADAATEEQREVYLNPYLRYYYEEALDQLDLSFDASLSRTVSTTGETLNAVIELPLDEGRTGYSALTLSTEGSVRRFTLSREDRRLTAVLPEGDLKADGRYSLWLMDTREEGESTAVRIDLTRAQDAWEDEETRSHETYNYTMDIVNDASQAEEGVAAAEYTEIPERHGKAALHFYSKYAQSSPTTLEVSGEWQEEGLKLTLEGKFKSASPWVFSPFEIVNPQNLMEMTEAERLACAEEWLNGAAGLLQANAAQEGDGQ